MKRGVAQVLFRYTPGAIFKDKYAPWCTVSYLELRQTNRRFPSVMRALKHYLEPWLQANPAMKSYWQDPIQSPSRFAVGIVDRVHYQTFPLVLQCRKCKKMHWYSSPKDMMEHNSQGQCVEGCKGKGLLRQYPYAYIHATGEIQPLIAPRNSEGNYKGIRMHDTGKFISAYWIGPNGKRLNPQRGNGLGLRTIKANPAWTGTRVMRGIHLGQPERFYSHTISVVDIDDEKIHGRIEHPNFGEIQLGSYIGVSGFKPHEYKQLFNETVSTDEEKDPFLVTLEQQRGMLPPEVFEQLLQSHMASRSSGRSSNLSSVKEQIDNLISGQNVFQNVRTDASLNEYLYCRYELDASISSDSMLSEAEREGLTVDKLQIQSGIRAGERIGLTDFVLHEQFPVLLAAIGFTRDSNQPGKAILRPFRSKQDDSFQAHKVPIPITLTKNEAIMFSLDSRRVIAFLKTNGMALQAPTEALKDTQLARAWLYQNLPRISMDNIISPLGNDKLLNGAILVQRTLHSLTHLLMHAGKKYMGLEMDSLSEYLFPSALSAAIYVSKPTNFSLGAIVTSFRHDLERWLSATRDSASSCVFDPVCRTHGGACHACTYLKFSCQLRNQGLDRGLLFGIQDLDGKGPLIGYWSEVVTSLVMGENE